MRKEYFEPYMQWLFPLLEEFEQVKASSSYGKDQARMAGYLAERLFGVYYTWLKQKGGVRCCELPYVIFGKGPQIRQFYLWDQGPRLVIDMRKINLCFLHVPCAADWYENRGKDFDRNKSAWAGGCLHPSIRTADRYTAAADFKATPADLSG